MKACKNALVLFWCLLTLTVGAQPYERQVDAIAVRGTDGAMQNHPFLGGLNAPRLQFVDIDADGDVDLFVKETGAGLLFFENTGTPQQALFTWRTDDYADLEVGGWARFADMDADGDVDLLAEQPFSRVRYYRNTGTPESARFVLVTDTLRATSGTPIFADAQNIPALADIDCDGLPDLFLGTASDGHLIYYRHTGTDAAGLPRYELVSEQYQGLEIIGDFSGKQAAAALHGANAITFGDVDGDGMLDLFWGDFFSPSLYFIHNTGTCAAPMLERTADIFPLSAPLMTSGFNAPALTDIDGDGDADLFAGVLGGAFGASQNTIENTYFFEQQPGGTFALRTSRYLSTLDVGDAAAPAFADLDGDGDLDLLVGNEIDPVTSARANLAFYRNEGSPTAPAFRLVDADFLDLGSLFNAVPVLADLDSDGDADLLVGGFFGEVMFFRNEGSGSAPDFVLADARLLSLRDTPSSGSFAAPALADLDADGDLDLFLGEASGALNFFRNDGSASSPAFTFVTDMFGGIDAGSRSVPLLQDLDADGDLDLLVGTEQDGLIGYRNTGTTQAATFALDPTFDVPAPSALLLTPVFADINADGDADVFIGTRRGGVFYFDNRRISTATERLAEPGAVHFLSMHPNPFRSNTTIQFGLEHPAQVRIVVYDVLGRAVATLADGVFPAGPSTLAFENVLSPGVYFVTLVVAGQPSVARSMVRM